MLIPMVIGATSVAELQKQLHAVCAEANNEHYVLASTSLSTTVLSAEVMAHTAILMFDNGVDGDSSEEQE